MEAYKHVTVLSRRTGEPIAAAHHYRGRLGGYAVSGSARKLELQERAGDASEVENDHRMTGDRLAAVLRERVRYGTHRGDNGNVGKLSLGDDYQPMREARAAGFLS